MRPLDIRYGPNALGLTWLSLMRLGSDGIDDDDRMYQCFLYMRDPSNPSHEDSNHYALPLPIAPVIETRNYTVKRVDILPMGADRNIKPLGPIKVHPANEYTPEHQELRTDLKPLQVVQPEGASFKSTSLGEGAEIIQWQKWFFRVSFNAREGMVVSDVSTLTSNGGISLSAVGPLRWSQTFLPPLLVRHEHSLWRPPRSFPPQVRI